MIIDFLVKAQTSGGRNIESQAFENHYYSWLEKPNRRGKAENGWMRKWRVKIWGREALGETEWEWEFHWESTCLSLVS